MLRGDVALDDLRRFLLEGVLMKDFDHPNVLSLIGVCMQRDGLPLIVLPYMKNGDLKSFITTQSREFTLKDLLTFALNVAEGMAYLSERKFVHRDLASRNCMVDERNVVKVSDFGLSRDIYEREYYSTKDKTVKLPVKWMAPESFRRQIFTTKTDVWSFGVLVWELVTRGEVPYGSVDNWDLLRYIDTGKRLNQPHFTPDEVYGLMLQCWHSDPDNRPDFKTLVEELKQILQIPYQSSDVKPLYLEIIG
ncbi:hepatocyte growth factor receptor-like [Ptychodera flava]|uniref:hepatocyte growth factor receptor-like n=1 Tax=Ptychodera flava TaxID=63121 RepID=UPI00396AA4D3